MITYHNGFMIHYSCGKRLLVFFHNKPKECFDFYQKEALDGLIFENSIYYPHAHLDCLKDFSFIKFLEIGIPNIKDLSALKSLEHLEGLVLYENNAFLDCHWVQNTLKFLSIRWSKKILNLNSLKGLESLCISHINDQTLFPPNLVHLGISDSNLTSLNHPSIFLSNLVHLDIINSKLTSLNKIANCSRLKQLYLDNLKLLQNIDDIAGLQNTLDDLYIEDCEQILNYDSILNLNQLQILRLITKKNKQAKMELKKRLRIEIDVN